MKKIFSSLAIGATLLILGTTPTFAADITVGNGTSAPASAITDLRANFAIVDTNHPAEANGNLMDFSYYAPNTNPFHFFVVDNDMVVRWISDKITPTFFGVNYYFPSKQVFVKKGWNIGLYFISTGTIPFDWGGTPASYTVGGYGVPVVGTTLVTEASSNRLYYFIATSSNGFDQYGYNNRARIFNGTLLQWCEAKNIDPTFCPSYGFGSNNDKIVMKWNAEWDRGNAENWSNGPYNAWTDNEWNGKIDGGSGFVWHYKIVWVGDYIANPSLLTGTAYGIWGQFAVIMDQGVDPTLGHTSIALGSPAGYGAYFAH